MAIDNTPTTQDALSLIVQNYNNGLSADLRIDDENFIFETPTVNPDVAQNKNTRLRVRPIATAGLYGRITIYYNRIDMSLILDTPVITLGGAQNIADIIPLINDYFGINLVAADYVDAPLVVGPFTINAKAGSLMFIGGLPVTLQAGAELGISAAP